MRRSAIFLRESYFPADYGLFHLEADLRWIELTSARLTILAEQVGAA